MKLTIDDIPEEVKEVIGGKLTCNNYLAWTAVSRARRFYDRSYAFSPIQE